MVFKNLLSVIFNCIIIGIAYVAAYFVAVNEAQEVLAAGAFCFGVITYLLIRLSYKQDEITNKLLFRSYRLAIWSVPILLFIIKFYLYFDELNTTPYIEYKSLDDLLYFGVFVIAIWPLHLIFYIIGNTALWFEKLFSFLQLPITVVLSALLIIALGFAYKRLHVLKNSSKINFSVPFAAIRSLVPILLCTYLLVEIAPQYLK
ncbi:MAG: hypothetical protein V7784_06365 [Oceanospirillaceae bacterium]